jgi:hypothetical protein
VSIVLGTWEEQLTEFVYMWREPWFDVDFYRHIVHGGIAFRRHHGKNRLTDLCELEAVNVLLTTYHTLSADWKTQETSVEGHFIFSVRWKRIVLDEGRLLHTPIRKKQSLNIASPSHPEHEDADGPSHL